MIARRLACALFAAALLIGAAPANDLGAFAGRWQIDLKRTSMGRFGPGAPQIVRAPGFSFVFRPEAKGLSMDVYSQYPQPAPTRVTQIIPDGTRHRCAEATSCQTLGGNAADESFVYVRVDPNFLIRRFYIKGKVSEYTTYAVSKDRKTFTMIAWSAATPYWQNIQVFDRQP